MGELRGGLDGWRQAPGRTADGLYPDRQGRQRSARTSDTKTQAQKAARAAEALEASGIGPRPVQTEMIYPSAKRGQITGAGYSDQWLAGRRLEPTGPPTKPC